LVQLEYPIFVALFAVKLDLGFRDSDWGWGSPQTCSQTNSPFKISLFETLGPVKRQGNSILPWHWDFFSRRPKREKNFKNSKKKKKKILIGRPKLP
jgi:hypothetical protein